MKNQTAYPDPLAKWSDKIKDSYGLSFAKAIGGDWFNGDVITGNCNFNIRKDRIRENRFYVRGENDTKKFKDLFQKEPGSLDMVNLDWRIVNVVKKFCRVVSNNIGENRYRINIQSNDRLTLRIKRETRDKHLQNMRSMPLFQKVKEQLGIDMKPKGFIPKDEEELNIYEQMKEKPKVEIAEEMIIDFIKKTNNWPNIEKEKNKDLVDNGIAAVRIYTDPKEGVKIQFMDIEYLIYDRVNMNDFSDSKYYGYVDTVTIGDIARESNLGEEQLREVAKSYSKKYDSIIDYKNCTIKDLFGFSVDVLRYTFLTTKKSVYKKYKRKGKTLKMTKRDEDFKIPKRDNAERVEEHRDTWMEGSYIVGTNIGYDYKECENIIRDELNKAISPFVVRATDIYENRLHSFLDDIKPLADELQNIHNKIQHLRSELKPDLIVIDEDVLAEVNTNGDKIGFHKETLNILNVKGIIIQKRIDMGEAGIKEGNPAKQIATQQGGAMVHLLNLYAHYYNQIRDVTGINPAADGSLPADALLGVSRMAQLRANTATAHIVDAAIDFNKRVSEVISNRVHTIFRNRNAKHVKAIYERAVGKKNIDALEVLKDRHLHDFGFTIEIIPTNEEMQDFKEDLGLYLQQGLISPEIKSEATQIAKTSLKLASQYLSYMSKKRQEKLQQEQLQVMQQKSQGDIQSAQQASEGRIQEESIKTKMKLEYETAMSGIRMAEREALILLEGPREDKKFEQNVYLERIKGFAKISEAEYKENAKDERLKKASSHQSKLIDQRKKDKDPIDFENEFNFIDEIT